LFPPFRIVPEKVESKATTGQFFLQFAQKQNFAHARLSASRGLEPGGRHDLGTNAETAALLRAGIFPDKGKLS